MKRGSLADARQLDRIDRRLRRLEPRARVRVAREQIAQLRQLTRQVNTLRDELLALIRAHRPQLVSETGCGPLTAAILIGRTAGAERFHSDASFALQTGTAPIKCSSGEHQQHRLNRGGDRQLNHALHIVAITRAQHDPATKAYLARKQAEGKTKKGALRCLKRHLARRFHHLLALPAEPPHSPTRPTTPRPKPPTDPLPPPSTRQHRHNDHRRRPDHHALREITRAPLTEPSSSPLPSAVTSPATPHIPGRRQFHALSGPLPINQRVLSRSAALNNANTTDPTSPLREPNPTAPTPDKPRHQRTSLDIGASSPVRGHGRPHRSYHANSAARHGAR